MFLIELNWSGRRTAGLTPRLLTARAPKGRHNYLPLPGSLKTRRMPYLVEVTDPEEGAAILRYWTPQVVNA